MRHVWMMISVPVVLALALAGCGNSHTPTGPTVSITCSETTGVGNVTTIDTHCDKPVNNPAPVVVAPPGSVTVP